MRIGIVTFHFAYNYGAVLQAWALQNFLQKQNHDVNIINYCPQYHTERYAIHRSLISSLYISLKYKKTGFLHALKSVVGTEIDNITKKKERTERKTVFDDFIYRNLVLTKQYKSIRDLQAANIKCDMLIAGSDQIWNEHITNNSFDDAYYLQFGDPYSTRLIYAASLGETDIMACASHIKSLSYSLDRISCRERHDAEKLSYLIGSNVDYIIDPTLLLNAERYVQIEKNIDIQNGYILVYALKKNNILCESIKKLIEEGEKIIDISPIQLNIDGMDKRRNIHPGEFLSFIKNSKLVLTNSFHGTAFSIIYTKDFICFNQGNRNGRIEGLLKELNISNRLAKEIEEFDVIRKATIDYDNVKSSLQDMQKKATRFLSLLDVGV